MSVRRRDLLAGLSALSAAALAGAAAAAEAPPLLPVELDLPGDKKLARKALLLVPTRSRPKRLLVLCHGLGETVSERLGIEAWSKPYGLTQAYERLLSPPVERVLPRVRYFSDEHLKEVNASLAAKPFQGFAIACPFTPNVYEAPSKVGALDRYADWIGDTLLPAVIRKIARPLAVTSIGLDGVSLGGYVALEVFLRRPELFGAFGCVQGAMRLAAANTYADKLADALQKVGPRPLRVATSRHDPFRKPSERLVERLRDRNVSATLSVTPGPHSQTWLREVGSLDLLLHYDRTLRE